jgi:hypothetical protein
MANVRTAAVAVYGSQPGDGVGSGPVQRSFTTVTDTFTGTIVVGSQDSHLVGGVDYVDVPFVAKPNSFSVQGVMHSFPSVAGTLPDLDLELRDDQGNVLDSDTSLGPDGQVGAGLTPGRTYIYRVLGSTNGPTQFTITSSQFINGAGGSGGSGSGSAFLPATQGVTVVKLVRFTVNPLTGSVTARLLN